MLDWIYRLILFGRGMKLSTYGGWITDNKIQIVAIKNEYYLDFIIFSIRF